jgi:putative FmdB family regulatory protein
VDENLRAATSIIERVIREASGSEGAASVSWPVPTYEYKCPNGHVFEVFKRIADPPPERCEICGASPVETVLYPVPVHFRGSGFYSTDYGRGKSKKDQKESTESSGGESTDTSGGESKDKPSEKKAAEA